MHRDGPNNHYAQIGDFQEPLSTMKKKRRRGVKVATTAILRAHHPLWEYVGTTERPDRSLGARQWARDSIVAFSLKLLVLEFSFISLPP